MMLALLQKKQKLTKETRKIISEKNKGRKKSEKEIEELRKRNAGEKNPFYGKKHSETTKNKIKETCKNIHS